MERIYKINPEMLGPDATMEDVEKAVEWLSAHGYDCEATDDMGAVNHNLPEDTKIPDEATWGQMLDEVFWSSVQ